MKFINITITMMMFLSGLLFYNRLPQMMPMHWNVLGKADGFMPKNIAIWLFPLLALVMQILFRYIPNIDPNREKYRLFRKEWEIIQSGLVAYFAYIDFIIIYVSINPGKEIMPLMFIGLGSLFILLGNYMSKIRQNYFIGIKIPWTLASEENWNRTHRFASWCFVFAGIIITLEAFFIWMAPPVIFGSIFIASGLPIIYSFLLFKKKVIYMKYIYVSLALLISVIFSLKILSGEDVWLCTGGKWVRHGTPSGPPPEATCK